MSARSWPIPRDKRTHGPGQPPSSATGGRRCRSGRRPTPGSRRSGSSIPEGSTQLVLAEREQAATDARAASGAISSSRARRSSPACPRFLNPLPAGAAREPADVRPLAGRPRVADDGAVARQSGLAGLLRDRAGRDQRRPRPAMRAAVASRAARLAGRRVHGTAAGASSTCTG